MFMQMSAFPFDYMEIMCKQVSFRAKREIGYTLTKLLYSYWSQGVCVCVCVCVCGGVGRELAYGHFEHI